MPCHDAEQTAQAIHAAIRFLAISQRDAIFIHKGDERPCLACMVRMMMTHEAGQERVAAVLEGAFALAWSHVQREFPDEIGEALLDYRIFKDVEKGGAH